MQSFSPASNLLVLLAASLALNAGQATPSEPPWARLEEYLLANVDSDHYKTNLELALDWLEVVQGNCFRLFNCSRDDSLQRLLGDLDMINSAIERQRCNQGIRSIVNGLNAGDKNSRSKIIVQGLKLKYCVICQWDYALRYDGNRESINSLGDYNRIWPFFLRVIYQKETSLGERIENRADATIKQHAFYARWITQPQIRRRVFSRFIHGNDSIVSSEEDAKFAHEALQYILKNQFVSQKIREANTLVESTGETRILRSKNLFIVLIYNSCKNYLQQVGPNYFQPAQEDVPFLAEQGAIDSLMKLSANYHLAWLSYKACLGLTNGEQGDLERLFVNIERAVGKTGSDS